MSYQLLTIHPSLMLSAFQRLSEAEAVDTFFHFLLPSFPPSLLSFLPLKKKKEEHPTQRLRNKYKSKLFSRETAKYSRKDMTYLFIHLFL